MKNLTLMLSILSIISIVLVCCVLSQGISNPKPEEPFLCTKTEEGPSANGYSCCDPDLCRLGCFIKFEFTGICEWNTCMCIKEDEKIPAVFASYFHYWMHRSAKRYKDRRGYNIYI